MGDPLAKYDDLIDDEDDPLAKYDREIKTADPLAKYDDTSAPEEPGRIERAAGGGYVERVAGRVGRAVGDVPEVLLGPGGVAAAAIRKYHEARARGAGRGGAVLESAGRVIAPVGEGLSAPFGEAVEPFLPSEETIGADVETARSRRRASVQALIDKGVRPDRAEQIVARWAGPEVSITPAEARQELKLLAEAVGPTPLVGLSAYRIARTGLGKAAKRARAKLPPKYTPEQAEELNRRAQAEWAAKEERAAQSAEAPDDEVQRITQELRERRPVQKVDEAFKAEAEKAIEEIQAMPESETAKKMRTDIEAARKKLAPGIEAAGGEYVSPYTIGGGAPTPRVGLTELVWANDLDRDLYIMANRETYNPKWDPQIIAAVMETTGMSERQVVAMATMVKAQIVSKNPYNRKPGTWNVPQLVKPEKAPDYEAMSVQELREAWKKAETAEERSRIEEVAKRKAPKPAPAATPIVTPMEGAEKVEAPVVQKPKDELYALFQRAGEMSRDDFITEAKRTWTDEAGGNQYPAYVSPKAAGIIVKNTVGLKPKVAQKKLGSITTLTTVNGQYKTDDVLGWTYDQNEKAKAAVKARTPAAAPVQTDVPPPPVAEAGEVKAAPETRAAAARAEGVVEPGPTIIPKATGAKDKLYTVTGKEYEVEYVASEADELIPSNDPYTGAPSVRYDANQQARAENPEKYLDRIKGMINAKERLIDNVFRKTAEPNNGVPLAWEDGRSAAGAGRIGAFQRMYEIPALAKALREILVARAAEFGIDPAAISALKNPMIWRRMKYPANRTVGAMKALSGEFNAQLATEMTSGEKAVAAGKAVGDNTLNAITEIYDKKLVGQDETIRAVLGQPTIARKIINAMIDDGALLAPERQRLLGTASTPETMDQITDILVGNVVGDARLLAGMSQTIKDRIASVIPYIADPKHGGLTGAFAQDVRDAAKLLGESANREGQDIRAMMAQTDMFGGVEASERAIRLAETFRGKGIAKTREIVKEISEGEAAVVRTTNEPELFGDMGPKEASPNVTSTDITEANDAAKKLDDDNRDWDLQRFAKDPWMGKGLDNFIKVQVAKYEAAMIGAQDVLNKTNVSREALAKLHIQQDIAAERFARDLERIENIVNRMSKPERRALAENARAWMTAGMDNLPPDVSAATRELLRETHGLLDRWGAWAEAAKIPIRDSRGKIREFTRGLIGRFFPQRLTDDTIDALAEPTAAKNTALYQKLTETGYDPAGTYRVEDNFGNSFDVGSVTKGSQKARQVRDLPDYFDLPTGRVKAAETDFFKVIIPYLGMMANKYADWKVNVYGQTKIPANMLMNETDQSLIARMMETDPVDATTVPAAGPRLGLVSPGPGQYDANLEKVKRAVESGRSVDLESIGVNPDGIAKINKELRARQVAAEEGLGTTKSGDVASIMARTLRETQELIDNPPKIKGTFQKGALGAFQIARLLSFSGSGPINIVLGPIAALGMPGSAGVYVRAMRNEIMRGLGKMSASVRNLDAVKEADSARLRAYRLGLGGRNIDTWQNESRDLVLKAQQEAMTKGSAIAGLRLGANLSNVVIMQGAENMLQVLAYRLKNRDFSHYEPEDAIGRFLQAIAFPKEYVDNLYNGVVTPDMTRYFVRRQLYWMNAAGQNPIVRGRYEHSAWVRVLQTATTFTKAITRMTNHGWREAVKGNYRPMARYIAALGLPMVAWQYIEEWMYDVPEHKRKSVLQKIFTAYTTAFAGLVGIIANGAYYAYDSRTGRFDLERFVKGQVGGLTMWNVTRILEPIFNAVIHSVTNPAKVKKDMRDIGKRIYWGVPMMRKVDSAVVAPTWKMLTGEDVDRAAAAWNEVYGKEVNETAVEGREIQ